MNAQHTITTTPRYNFPICNHKIKLPQEFVDLSLQSLEDINLFKPTINRVAELEKITTETINVPNNPQIKIFSLAPDSEETPVIAIDVSSIKIGETVKGILIAIRGAIIWKESGQYSYLRIGPFPFHITKENQEVIFGLFNKDFAEFPIHLGRSNLPYIQTRLTSMLERNLQSAINHATQGSLVLWDGSLTAGTQDTTFGMMKKLLEEARINRNTILAISKISQLSFLGYRLTDLIVCKQPPYIVRIKNYIFCKGPMQMMGNIHIAKLSEGICSFRLDVDKEISEPDTVKALERLIGNDLVIESYPEALRLAHILSTFTATEVIGIQRCITNESNLRIITRPNVRRLLFGRYGKGLEG